jgi:hypothetical protein
LDSPIIGTTHDTRDMDSSAPIEVPRPSHSSAVADPGTSESASQSEDYRRDSNQSYLRLANGS